MKDDIAAIIWTYGRPDVAVGALDAVLAQRHPVNHVILVDSASAAPDTAALEALIAGRADLICLADNTGPGGAIAAALERLDLAAVDSVWFVEDDSRPGPDCLAALVDVADHIDGPSMLGPDGATMRRGQWRTEPRLDRGASRAVSFVYVDGALISSAALARVGPPRTDFFLMHVDVEHPMRLADAGVAMRQVGVSYEALRLGAADPGARPWRAYYQTRNHLRLALDRRSPVLLTGFASRTAKVMIVGGGGWATRRLRIRGVKDALTNRMGRRVEPGAIGSPVAYPPPIDDPITIDLLGTEYSEDFSSALEGFLATRGGIGKWATLHGNGPGSRMARFESETLAELEHHTGPLAGKRVLDFGCGSGTILPSLALRATEVVGFDINPEAVEITRNRMREHGMGDVPVYQADSYRDVARELGDFDLVIMHAVFEHVPLSIPGLRADVLQLAFDALRPGGHLVISESPNRLWPRDIYCTGLWGLPWTKGGSTSSYRRAVRADRHADREGRGPISLEERGAWGFTYWAVRRYLKGRRYLVVNAQPGHDRWVRYHRPLGGKRRLFESAAHRLLTRTVGIPIVAVAPMLSPLVLQRIDGEGRR